MAEQEKDEAINKLIGVITQQSSLLGLGSGKHGEEAIELKKEWFKHVLSSLEKTNQALDKAHIAIGDLQKEFHNHQLDTKTDFAKLKDFVNEEIKEIRAYHDDGIEKYAEKIENKLTKINEKLEIIPANIAKIKEELKDGLAGSKTDATIESSRCKDVLIKDEIKPLGDRVTNIYIKVMVLSTVAGIIASALLSIVLSAMKG
jgi:hypothetical protein